MTDYEVMPMDEYVSELVRSKDAELARLQAEVEKWKEYGKDKSSQLVIEQASALNLRVENERLREALSHIMSRYEEGTIAYWKAKDALK